MPMQTLRSASLLAALLAVAAAAADAPVKRTLLQKIDVPSKAAHECVLALAEVAPGASIGRHTHPGTEAGYVVEGSLVILVDGEAPRVLRANDTYRIEAGKAHDARNEGKRPVKIVGTWVVEKGKPLSTPAPAPAR